MNLETFLSSEAGLALVGSFFGGVWVLFKSSDWYQRRLRHRYQRALLALEAGVQQAYDSYVRAIKEARKDGKLTDDERKRARDIAREAAITFGRGQGVDVVRQLGQEFVDTLTNRMVRKLKRRT